MKHKLTILSVLTALMNKSMKKKEKTRKTKVFIAAVATMMIVTGAVTLTDLWVDVDCDDEE